MARLRHYIASVALISVYYFYFIFANNVSQVIKSSAISFEVPVLQKRDDLEKYVYHNINIDHPRKIHFIQLWLVTCAQDIGSHKYKYYCNSLNLCLMSELGKNKLCIEM